MSDLAHINDENPQSREDPPALQLVSGSPTETLAAEGKTLDEHVTYHPVTPEMIALYSYYVFDDQGRTLAAQHCDGLGMDEPHKQHFLGLLPGFAQPADFPFDQTHGFNIALTQGFFGPYFYINDAHFSSLGEVTATYMTSWQEAVPEWSATQTAQNTLLSRYSSGRFIPAGQIARFMADAHGNPALTDALGDEFPGEKLAVLWAALQTAHELGAGLLEVAGAIMPDSNDLMATTCFSRFDHCDPASLQSYLDQCAAADRAATDREVLTVAPTAPELPVPAHMAVNVTPSAGERLPSTPSLTERLREKRGEI